MMSFLKLRYSVVICQLLIERLHRAVNFVGVCALALCKPKPTSLITELPYFKSTLINVRVVELRNRKYNSDESVLKDFGEHADVSIIVKQCYLRIITLLYYEHLCDLVVQIL